MRKTKMAIDNIKPDNCPLNRATIKQLLPHRDPILLVDRVISFSDENIITELNSSDHNNLFNGHFPDRAILPGIYMIEMAAQSGALLVGLNDSIDDDRFIGFAGVDNVKFKRPVQPDEILRAHVEIVKRRGPLYKFKGRVTVNDNLTVSLEFTASLMKYSG